MSAKANPARIGIFVIGALVLLVVAIVVFGSGRFFKQTSPWVAFFEGSLSGLGVGAPVTYRGVPIGRVTDIRVELFADTLDARVPVYFETVPEQLDIIGQMSGSSELRAKKLVQRGLRARLVAQSLVTGQLAIELNFLPDTPATLVGGDSSVPEIPTVPSTIQVLMGELQKLKLDELIASADRLLNNVDALVATPEAKALIPGLRKLIENADTLVRDVDAEVKPTLASVRGATDSAKDAFDQGRSTIANLDKEVAPALADLRRLVNTLEEGLPTTLVRLDAALASAQSAMKAIDRDVQPDSPLMRELRAALVEFARASRSVRELADELERKPTMLIQGK